MTSGRDVDKAFNVASPICYSCWYPLARLLDGCALLCPADWTACRVLLASVHAVRSDYISAAREVAFYAANNRLHVAGANGTAAADEAAAAAAADAALAADTSASTPAADASASSTIVDAVANGTAAAAEAAAAAIRRLLQDANATDVAAANATAPLLVNATANATAINSTTNGTANATADVGNLTFASPPPPASKSIGTFCAILAGPDLFLPARALPLHHCELVNATGRSTVHTVQVTN